LRFAVHGPGILVASPRSHRMPCGDVPGRVHVSVAGVSAGHAAEQGLALAAARCDVPARRAPLARVRGLDLLDPARGLVFQPADQQPPEPHPARFRDADLVRVPAQPAHITGLRRTMRNPSSRPAFRHDGRRCPRRRSPPWPVRGRGPPVAERSRCPQPATAPRRGPRTADGSARRTPASSRVPAASAIPARRTGSTHTERARSARQAQPPAQQTASAGTETCRKGTGRA